MNSEFGRRALEDLPEAERRLRLVALALVLTQRLSSLREWEDYWREVHAILTELRELDHDLWRHDFDADGRELWGWDYMKEDGSGLLQLQFHFQGEVRAFWRTDGPLLGVEDDL